MNKAEQRMYSKYEEKLETLILKNFHLLMEETKEQMKKRKANEQKNTKETEEGILHKSRYM